MPQPQIPLQPQKTYHIYTHANGEENLFRCRDNYFYFLQKYTQHIHPVVNTYAYCLMPNHLHLVVKIKSEKEVLEYVRTKKEEYSTLQGFESLGGFSKYISQQFSNLFNAYTLALNKKYSRKGSLFTPNFKRKVIDNRNYFTQVIAYVHSNPVHHGFRKSPLDGDYSSIHAYWLEKQSKIQTQPFKEQFHSKTELLDYHKQFSTFNSTLEL